MNFEFYGYTLREIVPTAILLITFVIQLVYYLGRYGRVAAYRQKVSKENPPVSVVVVLEDGLAFVEETLPLLMRQDYAEYEVVVVDYGSGSETREALQAAALRYPRLRTTCINVDTKYKRRRKLALSVGIKAARHPHILFTESYAYSVSPNWVAMMAKGFTAGDVVVGYAGIAPRKGLSNRLIRCSRLMVSVRYLSAAVRQRVYRGINSNGGVTAKLYFDHNGYNYQKYNTGDDDLFVRAISTRKNTAVVIHPQATVREYFEGGLGRWWSERRYTTHTWRHYPAGVRAGIFTELFSRALFFAAAAWCIATMIPWVWMGAAALVVLRWAAVCYTIVRICLRLGEKGLLFAFFWHDLLSPVSECLLSLSRKIRPSQGVWS